MSPLPQPGLLCEEEGSTLHRPVCQYGAPLLWQSLLPRALPDQLVQALSYLLSHAPLQWKWYALRLAATLPPHSKSKDVRVLLSNIQTLQHFVFYKVFSLPAFPKILMAAP